MDLLTMHQRMTAAEFAALPVGPPYSQLIEGEFVPTPSTTCLHQEVVGNLCCAMHVYLRAHLELGRVVLGPSDVELDETNVFEPDMYFVSKKNAGILTVQGASGAPDLVGEVLLPATEHLDRERKRPVYFRAGVRELWLLVPERQEVEIYLRGLDKSPARVLSACDELQTELIPGWKVRVGELFD